MSIKNYFLGVLFLAFLPFFAFSQNETDKPVFVPEEGIDGKDVIWWPTPSTLIKSMLDIAGVGPGDFVVDLGSGDGRIVIEAAKRGATAVGIEYNPDLVKLSEYRAKQEGVSGKATFLNMDLFEYDLSGATVITMYLLSDLNLRLRPSLLKLKPGTRIVSNTFDLGDWQADENITVTTPYHYPDGSFRHNVTNRGYYWIVPADVAGSWSLHGGQLKLEQHYQKIEGSWQNAGKSVPVTYGRMTGNRISFTIGDSEYTGTLENGRMQGTLKVSGETRNWEADRIEN